MILDSIFGYWGLATGINSHIIKDVGTVIRPSARGICICLEVTATFRYGTEGVNIVPANTAPLESNIKTMIIESRTAI